MPSSDPELSRAEARALAIAAQGLAKGCVDAAPLDVLRRLSAIQLDAIQRVDKAHRLVCLARVPGLQGRQGLDESLWSATGPAAVFESWAHAVCLLPIEDWPLWEFARRSTTGVDWAPAPAACQRLTDQIRDQGPMTLGQLEAETVKSSGWDWSETKRAAEYLLWTGRLICAERRGTNRVYDLPERRVPGELLGAVRSESDSRSTLVAKAARACSPATVADLAEYFRLNRASVEAAIPTLDLVRITVEGWTEPAWIHPAVLELSCAPVEPVFLTPFDNLIWDRERTRRLFAFDYVFEAYKTPAKRRYGYYVMPVLAGDALIGRADLSRQDDTLHALGVYFEPDSPRDLDAVTQAGDRLAHHIGCQTFTIDRVDPAP